MTTDLRRLANPEQLSETILIEILKNKCIEMPDIKTIKRSDLIEMFKRIAIPMPQRQYNEAKYLGKKLHDLRVTRKICISTEEDKKLYESIISNHNADFNNSCPNIKPSTENTISTNKTQFSNPLSANHRVTDNCLKRKINEEKEPAQTDFKKRHKITWP